MTLKYFSSRYLCNTTMLGFHCPTISRDTLQKAMQERNLCSQGKAEKVFCLIMIYRIEGNPEVR